MNWYKLFRLPNLLLIALTQLVLHFGFLKYQGIRLGLSDGQFLLLVLSTVFIAAAGYLINDILDTDTDAQNGRIVLVGSEISEQTAYGIYVALNIIGVGIGCYLSYLVSKPGFTSAFVLVAVLLYLYSDQIKNYAFFANLLIAFLVSAVILIVGLFDIVAIMNPYNREALTVIFGVIADYAIFAFLINFLREIVKDIQDMTGDYNQGRRTVPIVLGRERTQQWLSVFTLLPVGLLVFYLYQYLSHLYLVLAYFAVFVIVPLAYFAYAIRSSSKPSDYKKMSGLLKLVLLFGVLSLLIVVLNIRMNVQ